jgi:arylsulfatase A-like enzyme
MDALACIRTLGGKESAMKLTRMVGLRRPSQIYRTRAEHQNADAGQFFSPRTREWLAASASLGLLWGLAEIAVQAFQRHGLSRVTAVTVRLHDHAVVLNLAAAACLMLALGGLAAALARGPRSRLVFWVVACCIAMIAPLLALESLHPAAASLLGAGLGCRLATWGRTRGIRLLQHAWLALLPVSIAAGLLAEFHHAHATRKPAPAVLGNSLAPRDNVVLLVLDTVRADHLSLHGYHRNTTPNLDRLAASGLVFNHARSTSSWTLPAHASMLTGRWYHELSAEVDQPLDHTFPTITESLREQGYATGGFVGNVFYCNAQFGIARGFSHYEDHPATERLDPLIFLEATSLGRGTAELARRAGWISTPPYHESMKTAAEINSAALGWLDSLAPGQPFFLFCNWFDAHGPYALPPDVRRPFTRLPEDKLQKEIRDFLRANPSELTPLTRPAFERQAALALDAYDDCIWYMDQQLARLVNELEARGLWETTWIIVTSDHGEQFGEHGLHRHGNSLHRQTVHVPLIVVPPRGRSFTPRALDLPVSIRDIAATIQHITAPDHPAAAFPGLSLLARAQSDQADTAHDARLADPPLAELRMPKDADLKRINGDVGGSQLLRSVVDQGRTLIQGDRSALLFDLWNDPEERTDLSASPAEQGILEALRSRLGGAAATPVIPARSD